MTIHVGALLDELGAAHNFRGALCIGRWRLMDAGGPEAEALCARCPAEHFDPCAALAAEVDPSGCWAGTSYPSTRERAA